jgi:hypothetical protein
MPLGGDSSRLAAAGGVDTSTSEYGLDAAHPGLDIVAIEVIVSSTRRRPRGAPAGWPMFR